MKQAVKKLVQAVFLVLGLLLYLPYRALAACMVRENAFRSFSQVLALFPGRTGSLLRVGFYRLALRRCSASCHMEFLTTLATPDVVIGRDVYIGSGCNLSRSEIGDDCLIGSGVMIMSGKGQHVFKDPDTPIRLQGGEKALIHVGRDCWLGNGALVMADIGEGSVVAAGAVVTKSVPPYSIMAGNPASSIGERR